MSHIHTNDTLFLAPTDENEVLKTCLGIKSKSSTGHDEISNKLLKNIILNIAKPLSHIFNQSLYLGLFPDSFKIAKVIPVFKTGDKKDTNNYRPISLLPAFSKILEKIVYKRVMGFILKHNLIYPEQYGFLHGRSTEHAILDIVHRIVASIERKQITIGVFLDLSKAFDTLSHKILLNKLEYYGLRGVCKSWFESYLSDRFQYVYTNNTTSTQQPISHGVPQGSVLGPLLFLQYVNDMPYISSILKFLLFADDTTGLHSASSLYELFSDIP